MNSVIKGHVYKGIIGKFHGKKSWGPKHDCIKSKYVIMRCIIKGLHSILLKMNKSKNQNGLFLTLMSFNMCHIHYADRTFCANLLTKFYALTRERHLYRLLTHL